MKREKLAAVLFAAVMVLALAASAGAVDGTIEINQAKVLAAGGFPFSVSTGGSYRLTSNLTVSSESCTGGLTTGNDITIDLNGFSMIGPGCGAGISVGNGVTVENGTVTGFSIGVEVQNNGIVRNVHADANGQGISVGNNSVVEGCTVNNSTNHITDSVGLEGGTGSTISGNTVNGNPQFGIECASCTISGNTVGGNGIFGIIATGSQIFGNALVGNSGTAINCSSGCLISGNAVSGSSIGISAEGDATTGYGGNVLNNTTNHSGGTSLGNNLCSGTVC